MEELDHVTVQAALFPHPEGVLGGQSAQEQGSGVQHSPGAPFTKNTYLCSKASLRIVAPPEPLNRDRTHK